MIIIFKYLKRYYGKELYMFWKGLDRSIMVNGISYMV